MTCLDSMALVKLLDTEFTIYFNSLLKQTRG